VSPETTSLQVMQMSESASRTRLPLESYRRLLSPLRVGAVVLGVLGLPNPDGDGDDAAVACARACIFRSSTLRAHRRVMRTSTDGSAALLGQYASQPARCCRCVIPLAAVVVEAPPLETRSASRPSDKTHRNASIVASIKGRARLGLQVRMS